MRYLYQAFVAIMFFSSAHAQLPSDSSTAVRIETLKQLANDSRELKGSSSLVTNRDSAILKHIYKAYFVQTYIPQPFINIINKGLLMELYAQLPHETAIFTPDNFYETTDPSENMKEGIIFSVVRNLKCREMQLFMFQPNTIKLKIIVPIDSKE